MKRKENLTCAAMNDRSILLLRSSRRAHRRKRCKRARNFFLSYSPMEHLPALLSVSCLRLCRVLSSFSFFFFWREFTVRCKLVDFT